MINLNMKKAVNISQHLQRKFSFEVFRESMLKLYLEEAKIDTNCDEIAP